MSQVRMPAIQDITDEETNILFNTQSQGPLLREKPATQADSSVRLDLIDESSTTINNDILEGWRYSGTDVHITASGKSRMKLGSDLNSKAKIREAPMNPGFSLFNGLRKQEFSNTDAAQQLIVRKSQYQARRSVSDKPDLKLIYLYSTNNHIAANTGKHL